MPGKKKGRKGKKKDKAEIEPEDHYMTMKHEQLEQMANNLRDKLNDAKVKRNMLQIEKDMIHDFYTNTRQEITEKEAFVSNLDTEMQKIEQDHRTQITSYMQKVKHLDYDHSNNCEEEQTKAKTEMKNEKQFHAKQEENNRANKERKKDEYKQEDVNNIAETETNEQALKDQVNTLLSELENEKEDLINSYEIKMQELKEELELRMKVEVHEIEERKNQHRNELMENHARSFKEMKDYQNQITRESLELIKVLKERLQDIKDNIKKNDEIIESLETEMNKFREPLTQAKAEAEHLKRSVATFHKDAMALRNAKGSLKDLKTKNETIITDREKLDKKFKDCEKQKDSMYSKFEQAIEQLRSRADFKNEKLEEKMMVFENELEKKELTFRELAQRCGLAQDQVDDICKKMEEAIEAKNSILRNLKYSLAHAIKAYNDAIRVYEAKLVEFGIPAEELGLEPLVTNTSTMPAGLVAA